MLKVLKSRIFQKHQTSAYPASIPAMPERYKGLPKIANDACKSKCNACIDICPVNAISKMPDGTISINLGKCIFCNECEKVCSNNIIKFTNEHRMTVSNIANFEISSEQTIIRAQSLKKELLKIFKRSFKLRQVSAGGCGACEADINVLGTVGFDLGRFGISFVASPRHADGLLVTGPVTKNMELALKKTYDALPAPKIVIATGACAISGGIFMDHDETHCGVDSIIPVDYYIPGCPPHPLTILDGLLTIIKDKH